MDVEMKKLIKSLSERKRRTFLRFMNGKKKKNKNRDQEDGEEREYEVQPVKMPTKDELLSKLQQLNVGKDEDEESLDENESDDDFYDYLSSEEEGSD